MWQYIKDRWELEVNFVADHYWFYIIVGIAVIVLNIYWFKKIKKRK